MAVIPSGARNLALVCRVNQSEIPRSARNDSLSATVSRMGWSFEAGPSNFLLLVSRS